MKHFKSKCLSLVQQNTPVIISKIDKISYFMLFTMDETVQAFVIQLQC